MAAVCCGCECEKAARVANNRRARESKSTWDLRVYDAVDAVDAGEIDFVCSTACDDRTLLSARRAKREPLIQRGVTPIDLG